ncbi:MAG: M16 family metallopeptidase [Planctomycetota bacterium]|jgi:zinc protease
MRRLLPALLLLCASLVASEIDLGAPLPVDPNISTMGRLPNGLRYWIRPNATPPGKVSLLLHIHSGSLDETEEQRGLAHFLEHMAFNGSEHFPPGEMVKFFESLGMRFGQHQNAFTSYDQTSYMMRLPQAGKETLEPVLLYFGDVAFRLSLPAKEIDKERGVILEEKRARKGVRQRLREKTLPLIVPGSRLAERSPIGREEVITGAPREQFVAYYRTWYRPGNATLLVCGDVEPAELEPLVRTAFEDWKPVAKPVPPAAHGIRYHTELAAAVVTDPELTEAEVGMGGLAPLRPRATLGDYRARLVERIGTWIVNRRLRRRVQKGEAPFQRASVDIDDFLSFGTAVGVEASGEPKAWKAMLQASLVEVKRARVHGFLEGEFADASKAILARAEQAAEGEPTQDSIALLMRMNGALTRGEKPMSRAQAADLTRKLLPTVTRAEVHEAFQEAFRLDRGLVLATLPEKDGFAIPSRDEVLAAAREALATEVGKQAETARVAGLLEKDPEPARVVARKEDRGLGILSATLQNGVRVHCRAMDFKKDRVLVRVRLVGGGIDETAETAGLTRVGSLAWRAGSAASQRHAATDLSTFLTGKRFRFGGGPDEGGLFFQLSGSPQDLEEGFRLMHLLLTEPRLEPAALDRWKQQMSLMLPNLARNVGYQAEHAVTAMLSGDDPRLGPPTAERVRAVTVAGGQQWLERILRTAPIEAAIVGDLDRDRMLALARRYLGTLPARPVARDDLARRRQVRRDKGPHLRTVEVETITPRAVVRLGWRGPAFGNRKDHRVLIVAAQILTTRLVRSIREERQLTYSIGCGARPSTYDGLAQLLVSFTSDPDQAEEAAGLARAVVEDFKEKAPPTDEELAAVKKQIANVLGTQLAQPSFWVDVLSSLETRGRDLAQFKTLARDYASITREQIQETLARYLTEERYYQVVAKPQPK